MLAGWRSLFCCSLSAYLPRSTLSVSLDELAEAMGTSPATLQRCFVARTGLPPMRYRRHLRVEAVLALLQAGDDRPLAALATEFGFANAYHLSRAVRAFSGRPPSAWRVG